MLFSHVLVLISALVMAVAASAYIRDTLRGATKPNRVSWFLWAVIPIIGTGAAIQAHADIWATVRIFLAGFLPLIVFLASFVNKQSYWHSTHFDWICGAFAAVAVVVWVFLNSPQMAILFAVIGDGFASLPTLIKAWKYPETETGITYVINLFASILVIPSIPIWNIENSAFQIYLLTVNALLSIAIYRKKWVM